MILSNFHCLLILFFLSFFTAALNPVENCARWRRSFMGPAKHGFEVVWENTFFPFYWSKLGNFLTYFDVKIAENSKNGLKIVISSET